MTALPLQAQVCGCAAVAHHPVADAVPARDQGGTGGQAGRVGTVIVLKTNPFRCNGIYGRRGIASVAVASQMVAAQGVDIEHDNTHKNNSFLLQPQACRAQDLQGGFYSTGFRLCCLSARIGFIIKGYNIGMILVVFRERLGIRNTQAGADLRTRNAAALVSQPP